jgi:hypothetical protein
VFESPCLFPHAAEKLERWSFTGDFGRNLVRLVNLQIWCFGCDIRREEGNLLAEYGFSRFRPSGDTHGSSRYSKMLGEGLALHLWGFGMVLTHSSGSIWMKRFERFPRISDTSPCFRNVCRPHDLHEFREVSAPSEVHRARSLLAMMISEVVQYESFVRDSSPGAHYRQRIATAPKEGRLKYGVEPVAAWRELRDNLVSDLSGCSRFSSQTSRPIPGMQESRTRQVCFTELVGAVFDPRYAPMVREHTRCCSGLQR